MKRLALLALLAFLLAPLSCGAPTPPVQAKEPLPEIPEVPSGSASAVPADIGASLDPGAPPPPSEPFPPIKGTLGGKPWELIGAATAGPVQKDGTVLVALGNYLMDCGAHEMTPDDRTLAVMVPWKARAKVDLAKLRSTEVWATAIDEKKKKPANLKNWKPKGSVEVLSAPTGQKSSGRIKIELSSGADTIAAEIPVKFCFPE